MAESRHMQMGALISFQLEYPDDYLFFTMVTSEELKIKLLGGEPMSELIGMLANLVREYAV